MSPTRVAAILLIVVACALGGFLISAHAARAIHWTYYGNQLFQVDFDDGTSIQYGYDENGNQISKTYGNQFHTITASAGTGGTISPSGSVPVAGGGDCTFTAMPNTGHYVANVVVDGNPMGAITGYTFTNVAAAHTISVSFTSTNTLPITASVNGDGTITPASASVNYGGSQTFTITPDTGRHVADVSVDGGSVGAVTSYEFSDVREPHTIQASFAINTYSITTLAAGSGTISPASPTVNYGGSQTFTITPVQGFSTIDVKVDTASQGPLASYTFTNVTANHILSASFTSNGPVKNSRTNITYPSLGAAYNDTQYTQSLDTILTQNVTLTESFTAGRNISVTIDGGYDIYYSANPDKTTLKGAPSISSGTVTWKNFAISN